tara:strand:- start:127 stop:657 length:531 start_codon:yes stop_codon:yes gene_type:complete
MAAPDHLNDIERKLIDKLRTGTYSTDNRGATATAWTAGNVKVFGQWPSTEHAQYPCIIVEHVANGLEEQFFGRHLSGTSVGEIMGVGYDMYVAVDNDSAFSVTTADGTAVYKGRRLHNYLMQNCANILMDTDFSGTNTEIIERHFAGFREIMFDSTTEIWYAICSMIITFKNDRPQ